MSSIPKLILQDGTSNEHFEIYFRELENSLSRFKPVRERNLRVIDDSKVEKIVKDEDYLRFVPLVYEEFKVIALFDAEHNYLLGFLTKEVDCTDGDRRRICYIIAENTPNNMQTINSIKTCVNLKYESEIRFIETGLGEAYPILEERAGLKRIQIPLGRQSLIEAIKFLSTEDVNYLQDNLDTMAKHCIVITQMFCESFRLRDMAAYGLPRFEAGFIPPEYLVIREHVWSIASRSLQSKYDENEHKLYFADVREEPLPDDVLHIMYDMLLPFDGEVEAITSDFEKVMTIKYLYATLRNFVKSRQVKFESTDKVTAMIHFFRGYVVLQYNHLEWPDVRVDVEVWPSNSLTKIEPQPLQDIEGRTFVTFKRVGDVPGTTFSSNWHPKDVDVDTKNLPLLDVLELSTKDYFESAGIVNFYESKNTLESDNDESHCLHFSHQDLYKGKTLNEAKIALEGLFDMKLVDDQVNPFGEIKRKKKGTKPLEERPIREKKPSKQPRGPKPNKCRKLIHGIYLNKFEVFVTVFFVMRGGKVQHTKLSIVCEGEICRDDIREIFTDWQQEECKCCTEKE